MAMIHIYSLAMIRHVKLREAFISGCHVTTVEGLGTSTKPHVVQQRVAEFHGSQCLSRLISGGPGSTIHDANLKKDGREKIVE